MIGITVINIPTINPFLPISGDLSFTPRYITIPPNIEKNIGTKYHILKERKMSDNPRRPITQGIAARQKYSKSLLNGQINIFGNIDNKAS